MSLLRILKSKGWISLILLSTLSLYLMLTWNKHIPAKRVKEQPQFQQTPFSNSISTVVESNSRLDSKHQQLLSSALAHIRLGYVANRTPHYSTPPLLVLYSCKTKAYPCGSLSDRLISITNHYYFSMLQQGSAFAYDMTLPVRFEWFFEPLPGYMSMNVDQANYYLNQEQKKIKQEPLLSKKDLVLRRFLEEYQEQGVTIVNTTVWKGDWIEFKKNPSMQALRDKYRLNHLPQKSDWFWIVSQLLFSQPTPELKSFLAPYQEIMGGKIDKSTSLSPLDPDSQATTAEFRSKGWFRIGLRLAHYKEEDMDCIVRHIVQVCQATTQDRSCHVFLSTSDRTLFNRARKELSAVVSVHAVAERYGFADLNESPESHGQLGLFESEGSRLKKDYARVFMDWLILTKMDYLIGQENDDYIKTVAWAAQVQTDLIDERQCKIRPMTDW